ncbi:MAG: SidA/IucD/PvdA family monooxygenase [Chitinophagaceae bacterium]|nr:SidA/IucD/PvdA family monooxygenase [Chitinophagaceae bacterium]
MIYDLIGIGIGPFNLGLAALTHPIPKLKTLFVDQKKEFSWHPGLMLDTAKLQVPFYADLVTLADPCSPFSFLAYLKHKKRLFRFAIRENNFIYRNEYNDYCKWVIEQLPNCIFGQRCEAIYFDSENNLYKVAVKDCLSNTVTVFTTRKMVIGIGAKPSLPDVVNEAIYKDRSPQLSHSADYLKSKDSILKSKSVTIIGSGQSAAEIFMDLLPHHEVFTEGLNWFTRSRRFFPMEYTKLSLEMTSPEYIDHFFSLPNEVKTNTLQSQDQLYKGINQELIAEIYEELYRIGLNKTNSNIRISTNTELVGISQLAANNKYRLTLKHTELNKQFEHINAAVIFATGYKSCKPAFIKPVKEQLQWKNEHEFKLNKNYSIDTEDSVFVQNADLKSHGFNSADLGMGPYRNAVIINSILGYNHYNIETGSTFQTFGLP